MRDDAANATAIRTAGRPRRSGYVRPANDERLWPTVTFGEGIGTLHLVIETRYVDGAQEMAEAVADVICDDVPRILSLRQATADARRGQADAEHRIALLTGVKRRISGALAVRMDEHRGGCWLVGRGEGPEKIGFYYASLADLWADCPDLRPVWWGSDEHGPVLHVDSQPIGEAP